MYIRAFLCIAMHHWSASHAPTLPVTFTGATAMHPPYWPLQLAHQPPKRADPDAIPTFILPPPPERQPRPTFPFTFTEAPTTHRPHWPSPPAHQPPKRADRVATPNMKPTTLPERQPHSYQPRIHLTGHLHRRTSHRNAQTASPPQPAYHPHWSASHAPTLPVTFTGAPAMHPPYQY